MTGTGPQSAASWICRRWVRVYTDRLPRTEAQRRREEIECDLFEHAAEAQSAGVGLRIRSHTPRRSLHLIIAGAFGPAVWLWFLPSMAVS